MIVKENGSSQLTQLPEGEAWAVSMECRIHLDVTGTRMGGMTLSATQDSNNTAGFRILRDLDGFNGIRRYIFREGTRLQRRGDEIVLDTPAGADWTAELTFLFCEKNVCLFMKQPGGDYELVTSYPVDWEHCSPVLQAAQDTDVELSVSTVTNDPQQVRSLYDRLRKPEAPIDTARILFLGNSCLFYYDVPSTLARLAKHAGYWVDVNIVARSSATISMFVDPEDYLYTLSRSEMAKGYDTVVFQGLSTDIDTEEKQQAARSASAALAAAIRAAGAQPYMYNRPARLIRKGQNVVAADGKGYDVLYGGISEDLNIGCAYVNRAFTLAYQENENVNLWYTDDAHSNARGSYLAACVLFASCFHASCENVGDGGLPATDAAFLRQIADRVAIKGEIPNW